MGVPKGFTVGERVCVIAGVCVNPGMERIVGVLVYSCVAEDKAILVGVLHADNTAIPIIEIRANKR